MIYNYNPVTKEYTGYSIIEYDPVEGKELIPANATKVKPDVPKDGYVMVFSGTAWNEVEDLRGKVYWDETGNVFELSLGESLPEVYYTSAPDLRTEEEKIKDFTDKVRSEVARRILAHASQGTQMNMAAAAAAGMFGEAELKAFQAGLQWVGLVRQKGQELIINGVSDYTSDEHWPVAPEAAAELAKRF